MKTDHEPSEEFVGFLEWQIRTALRRRDRFARPATAGVPRWMLNAALILVSLFIGAAGVVAAERIQESRERELLMARAQVELDMATARLHHAEGEHTRVAQLVEDGLITESERLSQESRVEETRIEYARRKVDIEEIVATGRPPRDDLAAPVVGQRDFVMERLDLEIARHARVRSLARKQLERIVALHQNGLCGESELRAAEVELAEVEQQVAAIDRRRALREEFLAGEIAAEQVDLLASLESLRSELESAQRALDVARAEVQRARQLVERGLVPQSEVKNAELNLRETEGRVRLLKLEIEIREAGASK